MDIALWQIDIDPRYGAAVTRLFAANNRQFIHSGRRPKADFVANLPPERARPGRSKPPTGSG